MRSIARRPPIGRWLHELLQNSDLEPIRQEINGDSEGRLSLQPRTIERTVELAKQTNEFDWKKLPKELRVAVDSRPFEGADRVEATINLLGHAAEQPRSR